MPMPTLDRRLLIAVAATAMFASGLAAAAPAKTAADILAFETKVADKQWTTVERRQIDKLYNPAKASDLPRPAPPPAASDSNGSRQ